MNLTVEPKFFQMTIGVCRIVFCDLMSHGSSFVYFGKIAIQEIVKSASNSIGDSIRNIHETLEIASSPAQGFAHVVPIPKEVQKECQKSDRVTKYPCLENDNHR